MTAEIGRVLGGRYRLVAPIGLGASAQVFLADDVRLRRRVAVKMLHEALADDMEFLRRFRAEARAAAALSHPNVMAVYDWGDEDTAFIVTEYLGGGSLRALLDGGELLTPSQALMVGLEAARALDYAHRRGFVHRDIKPANLLFGEEQRLRIADFGLARALAEAAWTEPQGAVLGTARYASPEQAKGEKLSGKADVYSLALVLVESVTGEVPFAADTTLGTLMARVGHDLEVPDELGALRDVLVRAGRHDPDDRLDARALATGLLRAAKALSKPTPLPLAGALLPAGEVALDSDPTVHAADVEQAAPVETHLGSGDLDLDPPDWVNQADGSAPFAAAPTIDPEPDEERIVVAAPVDDDPVDDEGPAWSDVEPADADPVDRVVDPSATVTIPAPPARAAGAARVPPVELEDPPPVGSGEGGGRRRRWPWVAAVIALLAIAGGAAAAATYEPDTKEPVRIVDLPVPGVIGLQQADAEQVLEASGWTVEVETERKNDSVPGEVLEVSPAAGARLAKGEPVVITVSEGQEIVDVPQGLVGQPFDEVARAFTDAGLTAEEVGREYHEEIGEGGVIQYADGTPGELERGSTVGMVVSDGPRPRTVPGGLAGRSEDEASSLITDEGLEVAVNRQFNDDVKEGTVISQMPAGGTTVPRGDTVTIEVSRGPETVKVPNVAKAKTPAEAAQILRDAGLKPGSVSGSADGKPTTSPGPGTEVKKGSTVNIVLR